MSAELARIDRGVYTMNTEVRDALGYAMDLERGNRHDLYVLRDLAHAMDHHIQAAKSQLSVQGSHLQIQQTLIAKAQAENSRRDETMVRALRAIRSLLTCVATVETELAALRTRQVEMESVQGRQRATDEAHSSSR